MPLLVRNLTGAPVVLAAGNPARTIPASATPGIPGEPVNVTGEVHPNLDVDPIHGKVGGLNAAAFTALEAQSASLVYSWTGFSEYQTGALNVISTAEQTDVYNLSINVDTFREDSRARLGTKVLLPGGCQTSDGASLAVDLYSIDLTVGGMLVGYNPYWQTALTDVVLVGAGSGAIPCYEFDGSPAAVLGTNNTDKHFALVALVVGAGVELHGVFGEEDATATAVPPNDAAIRAALDAAAIVGYDETCGLVVGRILFQRGVGVITAVHDDVVATGDLVLERGMGTLGRPLGP